MHRRVRYPCCMANDFDAVLLLSFGGPEGPDDVVPFLENVTRGRGIPPDRLRQVGEHYFLFGGVSPINAACRSLVAALERELAEHGPHLPVYWGNRNWHPMLADTVARMAEDGICRAVAVATSAFSSYSACRQYLEDVERARATVGDRAPVIEKIPPFWNHPGFIETMAANTRRGLRELGADAPPGRTHVVFTAHSIPSAMAATCDYELELREASALVAERAAPGVEWELAYQSRSGPPTQPWLEPDVRDRLCGLRERGVESVLLVPIGFVADHMEVLYDLDTDARGVAEEIGLRLHRAATVGSAPGFVAALRERIADHVAGRRPRALGTRGPRPFPCAPGCCGYAPGPPSGAPRLR
jgi:protoporphyrin/coproporphyrin ferrochelatase